MALAPDEPGTNKMPHERRGADRRFCSVLSEVLEGATGAFLGRAIVSDISETGLALHTDFELAVGTALRVRNPYFTAELTVRNQRAAEAGFRVGCQFRAPVCWIDLPAEKIVAGIPAAENRRQERPTAQPSRPAAASFPARAESGRRHSILAKALEAIRGASGRLPRNIREAMPKRLVSAGAVESPQTAVAVNFITMHGIEVEHDRLVKLLAQLEAAIVRNEPYGVLLTMFADLMHLVTIHVGHEEAFMERVGYPNLEAHRWQHELLLNELRRLRGELDSRTVAGHELIEYLRRMVAEHADEAEADFTAYCQQIANAAAVLRTGIPYGQNIRSTRKTKA